MPIDTLDDQRRRQHAIDSLRRTGADRGKLEQRRETPRGLPVPTMHDGAPPPAQSFPPPISSKTDDAALAALRAENEALRSGRKRSPPGGIPVQVETTADLPISDAAIGRGVRHLLKRFWPLVVGALGLGAGGAGVLKPAADPTKADAQAVELEALKRDHAAVVEQVTGLLKREPTRDRYIACLEEQQREIGEQTLPSPDRMGSAKPPRPFVERCSRLKP